jgi:diguanylate cyclase (GGDEF)-like protein
LPGLSLADGVGVGEKIRETISQLRSDQQGRPGSTPTVSIGVGAIIPREGLEVRDLIKAADTALYQAKEQGRDCVAPDVRVSMLKNAARAA